MSLPNLLKPDTNQNIQGKTQSECIPNKSIFQKSRKQLWVL